VDHRGSRSQKSSSRRPGPLSALTETDELTSDRWGRDLSYEDGSCSRDCSDSQSYEHTSGVDVGDISRRNSLNDGSDAGSEKAASSALVHVALGSTIARRFDSHEDGSRDLDDKMAKRQPSPKARSEERILAPLSFPSSFTDESLPGEQSSFQTSPSTGIQTSHRRKLQPVGTSQMSAAERTKAPTVLLTTSSTSLIDSTPPQLPLSLSTHAYIPGRH